MPFVLEITHQAQNQGVQITLINKRPNHDWRETVSTDGGLKGSKRAPFESAYSFHPEIRSLKVYVLAAFKNAASGRLPDA